MSDTLPTATRVTDPRIRSLYRPENRWQARQGATKARAAATELLG